VVTRAAAKTKLDPKMFDFNAVMARSKSPKPKDVSVFLRPDLIPRIKELEALIDGDDDGERAIGDPDPTAALVEEYNALADEFEASQLVFEFRAQKYSDRTNARAAMTRDGHDLEADDANELAISYMLAETCLNAGWTGAEWHLWRENIGEAAFLPLLTAAMEANAGPEVTAPFSRRPLPGLTNEK
jgi:hypothetical protein